MQLPASQLYCGVALILLQLLLCTITVEGGCDLAADKARTDFYGHCPCSCQTADGFSCTSCPITCRNYYERCKPSTGDSNCSSWYIRTQLCLLMFAVSTTGCHLPSCLLAAVMNPKLPWAAVGQTQLQCHKDPELTGHPAFADA